MTIDVNSDLTQRLKDRDKSAWNAVSLEYTRDLYGFVVRLVGLDRSVADDIVQDVWLESLKRIHRFDPSRGEFRGWLFEIARRLVAGYWRKRILMPLCEEFESTAPTDPQLLPTEILDHLDRAAIVRATRGFFPAISSVSATLSRALRKGMRLAFWNTKPMCLARKSDNASSESLCTASPAP